jgi:uncharacterized RDD family membrane protein YckC
MAGERQYILKTVDGEEYGPADQETLIRWAQNGRITPYCQIRSTLIARWEKAVDIPFLRDLLMTQVVEEQEKETTFLDKVKRRMTMRAPEEKNTSGLHGSRPEDFEKAPMLFRILAAIIDLIVVLLIGVVVYLIFAFAYSTKVISGNVAGYGSICSFYVLGMCYFTFLTVFKGQTVGQKFWGIILIKRKGGAFWLGRAYVYALLLFPFGIVTPFASYVSGSRRSLQEILTGTRMVRVLLTSKKR